MPLRMRAIITQLSHETQQSTHILQANAQHSLASNQGSRHGLFRTGSGFSPQSFHRKQQSLSFLSLLSSLLISFSSYSLTHYPPNKPARRRLQVFYAICPEAGSSASLACVSHTLFVSLLRAARQPAAPAHGVPLHSTPLVLATTLE